MCMGVIIFRMYRNVYGCDHFRTYRNVHGCVHMSADAHIGERNCIPWCWSYRQL